MLVNVQFLRFIAAMLVVAYHTATFQGDAAAQHGFLSIATALGFAGVDVFFVISGFIMAHTTMSQQGAPEGWKFMRRRIARIYSGHWPFFILAALIFSVFRTEHFAQVNFLNSFLLWPQSLNRTLLEVTWTLTYEMYFYVLFALFIALIPARFRFRSCLMLTATFLVFSLVRHFGWQSFAPENFYFIPLWSHFLLSPFVLEFLAGVLLAYFIKHRPTGRSSSWLLAGSALFIAGGWINVSVYAGAIEQGFHVLPRTLIFGTAASMVLLGLVRLDNHEKTAPKAFSLTAGGASYAIYLSHILILTLLAALGYFEWLVGLPFIFASIGSLFVLALVLAYSVIHYRYMENPLHQRFKKWLGVSA